MNALPWLIVQRKLDGEVESVIAAFQHYPLARDFMNGLRPISRHYLELVNRGDFDETSTHPVGRTTLD